MPANKASARSLADGLTFVLTSTGRITEINYEKEKDRRCSYRAYLAARYQPSPRITARRVSGRAEHI